MGPPPCGLWSLFTPPPPWWVACSLLGFLWGLSWRLSCGLSPSFADPCSGSGRCFTSFTGDSLRRLRHWRNAGGTCYGADGNLRSRGGRTVFGDPERLAAPPARV